MSAAPGLCVTLMREHLARAGVNAEPNDDGDALLVRGPNALAVFVCKEGNWRCHLWEDGAEHEVADASSPLDAMSIGVIALAVLGEAVAT